MTDNPPLREQRLAAQAERSSDRLGGLPPPLGAADRWLPVVLIGLALGIAASSLLGPLVLGLMRYRTSPTTANQLLGSDTAALFVIAPLTLLAAVLAARRHPIAPQLALGIGVYAVYTYAQIIIGQEYLRLPGNVERFFPLLLGVFILAEAVIVLAWRSLPPLPRPSTALRRAAGIVLLLVATFLVFGQHLRPMITAWQDPSSLTEYASSPTPFWMVKLMDLGIIVPAAVAAGVGLLRGASWAVQVTYVLITGYTCLAISVAAMGVVMYVNSDPDASLGVMAGFLVFATVFATLTVLLYRPLLNRAPGAPPHQAAEPS
jgi:hypothetical protein